MNILKRIKEVVVVTLVLLIEILVYFLLIVPITQLEYFQNRNEKWNRGTLIEDFEKEEEEEE